MSLSSADTAFALELFEGLGPLTSRKMMGGLCLYWQGTIFAILNPDGSIWLKGAGAFAEWMAEAGWQRWTYRRANGTQTAMPYWRLPADALDDAEEACRLARAALAAL